MSYAAPAAAIRAARKTARQVGLADRNTATDAVDAVTAVVASEVAADVVNMAATALGVVERHDPQCTGIWDNDEPCDCSWAQIETVIEQLKTKVGTS